jgi:hypothetical protein
MKNSKIHFGLENSDLRDFLSISMVKNYGQEFENKKPIVPYRPNVENAFEYAIKDCENEIVFQNKRLQLLKEKQAIITLIKMQGWEEFDVSDETEKDLEHTLRMNFIGTQSEYDTLISALANER